MILYREALDRLCSFEHVSRLYGICKDNQHTNQDNEESALDGDEDDSDDDDDDAGVAAASDSNMMRVNET